MVLELNALVEHQMIPFIRSTKVLGRSVRIHFAAGAIDEIGVDNVRCPRLPTPHPLQERMPGMAVDALRIG